MAGSTIISFTKLENRLPTDATNAQNQITDAITMATSFVNGWAKHYDPFDEFTSSPDTIQAPMIIGDICLQVGEAMYFRNVAQVQRDGDEMTFWNDILTSNKEILQTITIEPEWIEQTISLDSNLQMLIGDRNGGGAFPRIIPDNAQVISTGAAIFIDPDEYSVRLGGGFADTFPDAWYLNGETTNLNGHTLRYMRTYRNDGMDYMRYGGGPQ